MREEYVVKKKRKMMRRRGDFCDWIESLVTVTAACVLIFTFAVRVMGIKGTSMINTLENQDLVVVSNLFYEPKQGDIVVLRKASFIKDPIVKRVIATEGQTVGMDFNTGTVYVDGEPLEEEYVYLETLPMRELDFRSMLDKNSDVLTVPKGCIFVLGDNRNGSQDSRDEHIGCVDTRYLIGRVLFLAVPGPDIDTRTRDFSRIGWVK